MTVPSTSSLAPPPQGRLYSLDLHNAYHLVRIREEVSGYAIWPHQCPSSVPGSASLWDLGACKWILPRCLPSRILAHTQLS
ncbi:hypothetical protein L3Q82_007130 [Scortum barcoo]|uniref:Uncharacterized protein n=1 Tax=Scortum barcoo TaxID=214431 RepID=A0ACB8WSW0_9TELE|nr:hypothetical protein L3Q82_007130 [Scortum barcoo]